MHASPTSKVLWGRQLPRAIDSHARVWSHAWVMHASVENRNVNHPRQHVAVGDASERNATTALPDVQKM
jgi:hypothetical protein